jgi:outer membrane protein TolC
MKLQPALILLLAWLALGDVARAVAQPATRSMTLPDALAFAQEHQPSLLAARARITARQAEAEIPRAQWMPRIAATAQVLAGTENNSTASYMSSPGVELPRIGGVAVVTSSPSFVPQPSTLIGVGLLQEIYDFGRIAAQSAAADANVQVEQQQSDVERLDVALAVTDAYYAVDAAKAVVTAAEEAYQRSKVHRDAAAAGVAGGLRRPIDQTRAEADLTRFDVGRIRAQGALQSAQAVFAAVVGVPDPLLDAGGQTPALRPLPEFTQALQTAIDHAPALRQAQAQFRAQQERTKAVAAELQPNLQLAASLNSRAGGAPSSNDLEVTGHGLLPIVPNYDVGVVLSWPLLDRSVVKRREASQQLENVQQQETAVARLTLTAQVQQAYLAAQLSDQALPALERSSTAAKSNSDQAQARFQSGMSTSLEVADAENLRVDAEIQLVVGRFEQSRARARLARTLGEGL